MNLDDKACPVVTRETSSGQQVLAFNHPNAGKQFVKGTIEPGEDPMQAAERELFEESGIVLKRPLFGLGARYIGDPQLRWHFFQYRAENLPNTWQHQTTDDFGHIFAFFWHPVDAPLKAGWHVDYHDAFNHFSQHLKIG